MAEIEHFVSVCEYLLAVNNLDRYIVVLAIEITMLNLAGNCRTRSCSKSYIALSSQVHPEKKEHPKFKNVAAPVVPLFPGDNQVRGGCSMCRLIDWLKVGLPTLPNRS